MALNALLERSVSDRVERWLSESGVVFVEIHTPRSGVSGCYYLVRSLDHLEDMAGDCSRNSVVFLGRWHPIKGHVDRAFIDTVLEGFEAGSDYFIATDTCYPEMLDVSWGDTEDELAADLREHLGEFVMVGPIPVFPMRYWEHHSNRDVIIARQ